MAKASWAGSKMVMHQISYESPALFLIFQSFFQMKNFEQLEESAIQSGVSKDEYRKFLAYVAGFYANLGNYYSFGDLKFAPELDRETFSKILKSNPLYQDSTMAKPLNLDQFYQEHIWIQSYKDDKEK